MPNDNPKPEADEKNDKTKPETVTKNKIKHTDAGAQIQYTGWEQVSAFLFVVYLFAVLLVGLWLIWDIFIGKMTWFQGMLPAGATDEIKGIFGLLLLVATSGWVGGALSAINSFMNHYAAPVENVGDLKQQEQGRYHVEWGGRWFWGPWIGAGLSVIVLALIRSGVLAFASASSSSATASVTASITEKFATIGLGGLVGLGSKDVVDKLIRVLKTWLRAEEIPVGELDLGMKGGQKDEIKYGEVITFTVTPRIAVNWEIDPNDEAQVGKIKNGVYMPPQTAPAKAPNKQVVVVTATSKADANRSASATFRLTK